MEWIPLGSFIVGIVGTYLVISKNQKEDTSQLTTVIVKLENIEKSTARVESELSGIRDDQKDDHDRLIKVEASAKQAHKRLDDIIGGRVSNHEEVE